MINNIAGEWIKKADADLDTVESLLSIEKSHPEILCFHCQQAVEKYFKSFLTSLNEKFTKTHDLDALLQACIMKNNDFQILDRAMISMLTDYAVDFRYPDDYFETTIEDAKQYYNLSKQVKELVQSKINKD